MSNTDSSNSSDNVCVVCFKNAEIYSIGVCDHPVCFECSTRMRVLCKQNECPICRGEMPKVIFVKKKDGNLEPFASLYPQFEKSNLQERRFGLIFCTSDIRKAYEALLEHRCNICKDWPYRNFSQLKDHMRKDHELFYCDICVDNLKIFTSERKCYNRQELGQHRRKGDPDNTSHRGHPLCEFCDTRYMDNDELFRHLRINHHYCHFCDSDGKNQYYNHINDLIRHFRDEHYLCDEGDCKNMPLTSVFRTNIDLKAHIATEHSRFMSKSATKQARTLEVEFTLTPRMRSGDSLRNRGYHDRRERVEEDTSIGSHNMEPGGPGGGQSRGESSGQVFMNSLAPQNFPALGGDGSNITVHARPATTVNFTSKVNSNLNPEDFPSLGGSKFTPTSEFTRVTVRGQQGLTRNSDNFPALGGSSSNSSSVRLSVNSSQSSNAPQLSIQVNRQPNGGITTHITTSASTSTQQRPTEAFPALGNTTTVVQPQWVQVKSKKQEPKASKVAPAPQLTPSSLEQFPSLSKKTQSVQNNWVNLNSINSKNASTSSASNNNSNKNSNQQQAIDTNKKIKSKSKQTESKPVEGQNGEISDSKNKNKKKKNKTIQDNQTTTTTTTSPGVTNINRENNNNSSKEPPKALNKKESTTNGSNNNTNVNGLVKKRSELNVGTLCSPEESMSNVSKDFPKLGETKPPPGFTVKPPPGLQPVDSFPSLGGADLTFTTSRGQSYSIKPNSNYHPPNNFQSRNQNLIKRLMGVLNNSDVIKEFKTYSDLFRNGAYPTKNYYEHCRTVLGNGFDEIFPELMVLLPDIPKQQELYNFYDGKNRKNLVVCEHCKQIIFKRELSEHYNYHILENQFPTLGKVQQVGSAWKN